MAIIGPTYCLRRVDVLLVPVLSFLSSLPLSFSTGAEPHDRPRLNLVWVLRAGPGTVDAGTLLLLFWWTLLELWFVKDGGPLDFEFCSWLWFCVAFSAPGFLSKRRSWFSWLTLSSCVSSSSIRRRCVSRSLAWFSIILLSSRRYSTARLGLSGFDSMAQALEWSHPQKSAAFSPPPLNYSSGGGGDKWKRLLMGMQGGDFDGLHCRNQLRMFN